MEVVYERAQEKCNSLSNYPSGWRWLAEGKAPFAALVASY
jgi:hypothetical protein